jgi:chaperonin GroEL
MQQQDSFSEDAEVSQKVVFREEAHGKLLSGASTLAHAVASTMGPSGHSVIIDNVSGSPSITKDGVTVAQAINLQDNLESMGAELMKEIASKTNDLAGDGTTTATVLGHVLLKEGIKQITTGCSSIHLRKGIELATEAVINFLKENCIPVGSIEDIVNVGTISANGDREVGELIAAAIQKVGKDGIITIEPAKSVQTSLDVARQSLYFNNEQ